MSKASKQKYYERKGFAVRQQKPTTFNRSENGFRYQYNSRIANKFSGWSTVQRDAGKVPMFGDFYNELSQEDQNTITVTEVFKT